MTASIAEQIAVFKRGCRRAPGRGRARRQARARQAAADQGGLRPDPARPAPRPHGAVQQAAPAAGPRPPHHLPDRRLHGADRRPDGAQHHAPGAVAPRRSPSTPRPTRDQVFLILDREKTEVAFNSKWLSALWRRRHDPARREVHGRADAGARRFRQALRGRPADRDPRVPLSAGAGLRLGRAEGRRRARRHRPEVQPAGRPGAAAPLRAGAAVHPDAAAARGSRRRQQDVEVARQLRRHHRAAERDVRQADVDLRRADVAVLRVAVVPRPDDRGRGAQARMRRGAQSARRQGRAGAGDRRPLPLEGRRRRTRWPSSSRGSATARCPRACPR